MCKTTAGHDLSARHLDVKRATCDRCSILQESCPIHGWSTFERHAWGSGTLKFNLCLGGFLRLQLSALLFPWLAGWMLTQMHHLHFLDSMHVLVLFSTVQRKESKVAFPWQWLIRVQPWLSQKVVDMEKCTWSGVPRNESKTVQQFRTRLGKA